MQIEIVQPYLEAARDIVGRETGRTVTPGKVSLRKTMAAGELSVLIGVTGQLEGMVLLSMSQATAISMAAHIAGDSFTQMDEIVQSAVAEMANVISGHAAMKLANSGHETCVSPPAVIVAASNANLFALNIPVFAIPLESEFGMLELQVALKEAG